MSLESVAVPTADDTRALEARREAMLPCKDLFGARLAIGEGVRRLKPGDQVVLAARLRRSSWHKLGEARVPKGARGRVIRVNRRVWRTSLLDVEFQATLLRQRTLVKSIPNKYLRRRQPLLRPGLLCALVLVIAASAHCALAYLAA